VGRGQGDGHRVVGKVIRPHDDEKANEKRGQMKLMDENRLNWGGAQGLIGGAEGKLFF
jgi:hypothetical protein